MSRNDQTSDPSAVPSPYGPHGTPGASPGRTARPRGGPTLVENLVYATVFATLVTLLLARSPLWDHLPDAAAVLPARYVTVLDALPTDTNTALAFLGVVGVVLVILLVTDHPVVGLSLVGAAGLGTAAYPYGRILWHRVFLGELERSTPGAMDWLLGIGLVALLLLHPMVLQVRGLLARYGDKGVPAESVGPLRRHLIETASVRAAGALGFMLAMGLLLAVLPGGTPERFFLDHSVLVLVVVGVMIIAAVGLGSGLFTPTPEGAAAGTSGGAVRGRQDAPDPAEEGARSPNDTGAARDR